MPPTTSEVSLSPFRTREERDRDRIEKREAVLRAAVQMFNARGFHSTSLDDVAASLGISKPTIYHYLGNKDQVLFECVTRGLDQLREAADAARQIPGTGLDRLKAFLRRYAEINMDDFGRCVVRTGEESLSLESSERFRKLKREIDQALRTMISDAVADGSAQADDVRLAAFTLAGALNWPARWYRSDGPEQSDDLAQRMVDLLCMGLIPSNGAKGR